MTEDAIAREGIVMLGSRLKRLAERLQAGAEEVARQCGIEAQPSQMPLLASLYRDGPASVGRLASRLGLRQPSVTRLLGNLAASGMVEAERPEYDRRSSVYGLTPAGAAVMERALSTLWPRLELAVRELCDCDRLLEEVASVEQRLLGRPLEKRPSQLSIVRYTDELAPLFRRLNEEWISEMFSLEPADIEMLSNPTANIIDGGGDILFVSIPGFGIAGTCALRRTGQAQFELTKMCVQAAARGLNAGEFLLGATIQRARELEARSLYLLTNSSCAAAIHLYEKAGFVHDPSVMAEFGRKYDRCDVAMSYPISG